MNKMAVTPDDHTLVMAQDTRVPVPRWVQLVALPLAVLFIWTVLRAAGPVLLLFVIGALVALLLNPFVMVLRRAGVPRGIAVLMVMLAVVSVLVVIGFALSNPIADQVSTFRDNVPEYIDDANTTLADVQEWLDDNGIDIRSPTEGQTALGYARPQPHGRLREDRHLHAGRAAHARGSVARADPRDRHQRLHAAVRRAHRRVPAPSDPAPP